MENPTPITTNMELLEQQQQYLLTTTTNSSSCSSSTSTPILFNNPNITYDPSKGIQVPGPADVICGRGKMTVDHPGNKRFRELVTEKKDAYQKARRRDDKTRITCELVNALRSGPDGGRFLLYDPNTKLWYDVGDEYAREKVSHSLRSRPSEPRRVKPKPRKKMVRKTQYSPKLDVLVRRLINDQQQLLKSMIEKETNRTVQKAMTSGNKKI